MLSTSVAKESRTWYSDGNIDSEVDYLEFAENLKRLRRARFWSQDELAKRSGVARQTIYRYEGGLSAPYARTVRALAEAFGLDPHELADPSEVAEEKQEKRAVA